MKFCLENQTTCVHAAQTVSSATAPAQESRLQPQGEQYPLPPRRSASHKKA
jgi:hypothetical protein